MCTNNFLFLIYTCTFPTMRYNYGKIVNQPISCIALAYYVKCYGPQTTVFIFLSIFGWFPGWWYTQLKWRETHLSHTNDKCQQTFSGWQCVKPTRFDLFRVTRGKWMKIPQQQDLVGSSGIGIWRWTWTSFWRHSLDGTSEWTPRQYIKRTPCNVISKFSEIVYVIYFIALKTWVNFVHRQKTTVMTRSLTVNQNRNEVAHTKEQWIKMWWTRGGNETRDKSSFFPKQLNNNNTQEMIIMLKWSTADERTLSDVFLYKNKNAPCLVLLIRSLKYVLLLVSMLHYYYK